MCKIRENRCDDSKSVNNESLRLDANHHKARCYNLRDAEILFPVGPRYQFV